MNIVIRNTLTARTFNNMKFDQLTLSKNGVLLKYRNQPEIEIPFSDFDQIYIKKHTLNPIVEFMLIGFPFLLVILAVQYLPFLLMTLLSIALVALVFSNVINYKWYQLHISLKDGTSFKKRISLDRKPENISMMEKVYGEYLHYNVSNLASA